MSAIPEVLLSAVDDVAKMLRDHYSSDEAPPFSLAQLGQWLSERDIEREAGTSLTSWAAQLEPEFIVVTDPKVKARRAVVPPARSAAVLASWAERTAPSSAPHDLLDGLPRPILVAFHLVPEDEDARVFVRFRPPPARYEVGAEIPHGEGWVEVDPEFRPAEHEFFGALERLAPEARVSLERRVREWMKKNSIEEDEILSPRRRKNSNRGSRQTTALERLIEAQSPAVRRLMLVPADIAAILLEHP